jgi:hypothetical protein
MEGDLNGLSLIFVFSDWRLKEKMDDCRNCTNAIFDEIWGEYKCKIDKKRHYLDGKATNTKCGYHKKGTPAISKNVPENW